MTEVKRKLLGSLHFETEVMRADECVVFVKAAMEGGVDLNTAYEDMKMIDGILAAKRLHFATRNHNKYTRLGNIKKDSTLLNVYDDILDGRIKDKG